MFECSLTLVKPSFKYQKTGHQVITCGLYQGLGTGHHLTEHMNCAPVDYK